MERLRQSYRKGDRGDRGDEVEFFDFTKMFVDFFESFDKKLKPHIIKSMSRHENSGSTATVVLQTPTKYICANLGDSEAWLLRENDVVKLSTVLGPKDQCEIDRIVEAGGKVINNRIYGYIAVSRSFGDYEYKEEVDKYLISCVPIVNSFSRTEYEGTLLLACDGFFDIMNCKTKNHLSNNPNYIQDLLRIFDESNVTIRKVDRKLELLDKCDFTQEIDNICLGNIVYYYNYDMIIPIDETIDPGCKEIFGNNCVVMNHIDENNPIESLNDFDMRKYLIEMLIRYAVAQGSRDNITLMLVTNTLNI